MKTFDERFIAVYPRITAISGRFARTTNIPSEEYESALCEEFINIDKAFDAKVNNSYSAFVGAMLETKAKRLADATRKDRRYYDSIKPIDLPEADDEETKYPVELIADVDIEAQVFDELFVEEQLASADNETRSILEIFFADPYVSYREIASRLGLNDKLVKRRLQSVAEKVRTESAVKAS